MSKRAAGTPTPTVKFNLGDDPDIDQVLKNAVPNMKAASTNEEQQVAAASVPPASTASGFKAFLSNKNVIIGGLTVIVIVLIIILIVLIWKHTNAIKAQKNIAMQLANTMPRGARGPPYEQAPRARPVPTAADMQEILELEQRLTAAAAAPANDVAPAPEGGSVVAGDEATPVLLEPRNRAAQMETAKRLTTLVNSDAEDDDE
jgi:hypothetical protein